MRRRSTQATAQAACAGWLIWAAGRQSGSGGWLRRLSSLPGCAVLAGWRLWLPPALACWLRRLVAPVYWAGCLRKLLTPAGWAAALFAWLAGLLIALDGWRPGWLLWLARYAGWLAALPAFPLLLAGCLAAFLSGCFTLCLGGLLPGSHPAFMAVWLSACLPSCRAA